MNLAELVDELFDIFDKNNDGRISRREFVEVVAFLTNEKGLEASSQIFKQFDRDHDGFINKIEMSDLLEEMMY